MPRFCKDQLVQVTKDLPELQLTSNETGIIRGIWESPAPAYEVEFQVDSRPLRLFLMEHQIAHAPAEPIALAA